MADLAIAQFFFFSPTESSSLRQMGGSLVQFWLIPAHSGIARRTQVHGRLYSF